MKNPVLDLLSILENQGYEEFIYDDLIDYDDGENHNTEEAREVFNSNVDAIVEALQDQINDLLKLKKELDTVSVKTFIENNL